MKEFKDKIAVITGAASGIGLSLAKECLALGMKTVIADVEEPALRKAERDLKTVSEDVLAVTVDVSRFNEVEELSKKTIDRFGAVHLLFNNAGVSVIGTAWECTMLDWQWVTNVNFYGVIHGIKVFVPIMLRQNTNCHIVNTASQGGLGTGANRLSLSLRHAVVSLSETLYLDLKQRKSRIGVSVLCPGFIRTRIAESARNRPLELTNPHGMSHQPESQAASKSKIDEAVQKAMPPDHYTKTVFQGIKNDTFYILSDEIYKEEIRIRMENILQDCHPETIKGS